MTIKKLGSAYKSRVGRATGNEHIFLFGLIDMTLGQQSGHDTSLSHGQQLCEISSRYNMAVGSYGPDTDFHYMCTVTLTLEIWPWVKVMTHPWVMDNNCVKYYPDRTSGNKVMAQTRRGGWFLYTPKLFAGGGGIVITVRLRWIGDSPQNPVGNPPKSTVEIRVEIYLYSSHFPLTCASYLYNYWLCNIA